MASKKKVKRRPSKIILPSGSGQKDKMKAFRCDSELATLLNAVENQSDFITKALLEAFSKELWVTCPKCKGKGEIRAN